MQEALEVSASVEVLYKDDISKIPTRFTVVNKGTSGMATLLSQIKKSEHSQVLILGLGVGTFYNNKDMIPSFLGKEWTILVSPSAPTWEQNQKAIVQFSAAIQEDANTPRIGIFMAPPEFVIEYLFPPSKSGTYRASIYWLGLTEAPLTDMKMLRTALSRDFIQSPWLQCIFPADSNKLRIAEQEKLNEALLAKTNMDDLLSQTLWSVQNEFAALESKGFIETAKNIRKMSKKWWQFWR